MKNLCEKMERLIIGYSLNELEGSEKHIVEQHVQACPECSEILEGTRTVLSAVSHSEMMAPPEALCESVRRGVREQADAKRSVLSFMKDVASSFVRRPAFAAGSALAAVAVVMLLLLLPGPQDLGRQDVGEIDRVERGGEALKPLRAYLSECGPLLDMPSRPDAAEALSIQGREQWVHLKGQAMYLREQTSFRQYDALLSDLESLFGMLEARRGEFTPQDVEEIRAVISEKRLTARVNEFLKARR